MTARNDFAGVRGEKAKVEFTVYGLECSVHQDGESAQYFNLGKHLLQLSSDPSVKVDRYDVRLLLDEATRVMDVEPGQEAEDFGLQELEKERYLDLCEGDELAESPAAAAAAAAALDESGKADDNGPASNHSAEPNAQAYAAVGFDYAPEAQQPSGIISHDDQPEGLRLYAPPVSYPARLAEHLPESERTFKVMLQTAGFVRQAPQMEFLLRVKQAHNKNFGFLMPNTKLHPFFRWLVEANPPLPQGNGSAQAEPKSCVAERDAGLSQLAQYGSRDTAASDSSACSASSDAPSVSTHTGSMPADHDQPEQQKDKPPLRILGKRTRTGLTKIDIKAPQAEAAEQEPISYGPALAPEGYCETSQPTEGKLADAASGSAASIQGAGPAETEAGPEKGPSNTTSQAAGMVPDQAAVTAVAVEPSEPVAPGMEPEGPMPSSEMQLIITKLAGFIQRYGINFEATIKRKEQGNPRFAFLMPWNEHHWLYRKQLVEAVGEQEAAKLYSRDPAPTQPSISPGPSSTAAGSLDVQDATLPCSNEPQSLPQPAAEPHIMASHETTSDQNPLQPAQADIETTQPGPAPASTPQGSMQDSEAAAVPVVSEQPVANHSTAVSQADASESAAPDGQQLPGKEELSQAQAIQPVQLRLAKQAIASPDTQEPAAEDNQPESKSVALEHVTVQLVTAAKAPSAGAVSVPVLLRANPSLNRATRRVFGPMPQPSAAAEKPDQEPSPSLSDPGEDLAANAFPGTHEGSNGPVADGSKEEIGQVSSPQPAEVVEDGLTAEERKAKRRRLAALNEMSAKQRRLLRFWTLGTL
ncbi:hypothetical protein WJX74_008811 [Apatococcus lobatus]|uniref:SURP motif domain-containing protein n=1 Tax=Apatococcus lobatus TaxID=904363 RepID=A0AAW1RW20_9CHLO